MSCSRHNAGTAAPASACFNMLMIWLSLKRDLFMSASSVLFVENSTLNYGGFVGGLPLDMVIERL